MKTRIHAGLIATSLISSFSPQVFAAEAVEIAPIVVTATRTAQSVDESIASVSVITREDIEKRQSRNLGDVLRSVVGVHLTNNGGEGKASSAFLRGAESDHVIFLIDGHKIGSATLGTSPIQDLPISLIDRIEVVRGPRSSLYGSEAIGGVIQIFTKKGGDQGGKSFSVGLGSDDTFTLSGLLSGGDEDRWFTLGASSKETDGFDSCQPSFAGGCFADQPDDDGYRNLSVSLSGGMRLGESTELNVRALQTQGDSKFDGGFQNESETRTQVLGASLDSSISDTWDVGFKVAKTLDDSDNFLNGVFATRFDTARENLSWQNDWYLSDDTVLTGGIDYLDEQVSSTTNYTVDARHNKGLFGQIQTSVAGHDLQLAVRSDDNSQFGNKSTGNVGWGYDVSDSLRLTASFGTAYKAPTFNELFFPGFGNANLKPENSRSLEFGVAGAVAGTRWSANVFENRIRDLIAFDATFTPQNIAQARIRGIELGASRQIMGWDTRLELSLMDPENQASGANSGNVLNRRPEQIFNLDVDRRFGEWQVGATVHTVGRRYDDLANTNELAPYTVVDLRVETALNDQWLIQGRIDNAFDEEYETARLFNQPGRGFFVTLRYSDF